MIKMCQWLFPIEVRGASRNEPGKKTCLLDLSKGWNPTSYPPPCDFGHEIAVKQYISWGGGQSDIPVIVEPYWISPSQVKSHPHLVALCDPYDCGINAFFAPGARLPATTCLFLEQEEPKACQVQQMWTTSKKGIPLKTNMEPEHALWKRKEYRRISTNHQFLSSKLVFSGVLRKGLPVAR